MDCGDKTLQAEARVSVTCSVRFISEDQSDTAQEFLLAWKQDLEGMQEKTDETLRKARCAEQLAIALGRKSVRLGAFAVQIKETEEPNIARKIFLEEELSAAHSLSQRPTGS